MTRPASFDAPFPVRLRDLVDRFGDEPAFLIDDRQTDWGYVGHVREVLEGAASARGIGPASPVGVVLRERPSTCAALLAVLASGRAAVLLSSHLPDQALREDLEHLGLSMVVADVRDWARAGITAFISEIGAVGIEVSDESDGTARVAADGETIRTKGTSIEEGTAVQVLTSGTTGRPRRVPLPFSALDAARERVTMAEPSTARGVTINVLPLTTIGGIRGIAETVWRGRPLVLMERFDVWKWARLVHEHRPRRIGLPPASLKTLVDERVPPEWFTSVECLNTGSAPLHLPTVRRFIEVYGIPVLNAYGSTEFGGRVAEWRLADWESWHDAKLGSVGRPMSHVDVRIADARTGTPVPDGEVGVIEVRFRGGDDDSWVRTNDLARLDADGFLWVEGRVDDVIIRGGFKVPVGEVEAALEAHPQVDEAVVVGLDDERLGQVPAAVVTLRDPLAEVEPADLVAWVRDRLVPYKAPRTVRVVDAIPRNDMMKPLRREVRRLLAASDAE